MKTTVLRVSKSFAFLGFPDSSVGKKIHLKCRRPWFYSWVRKIRWRRDRLPSPVFLGFPYGSAGKESTCNVVDLGSVPGLGRSPGEENNYPLQYSGLENSMDCIVHKVAKSQTRLSNFHLASCLNLSGLVVSGLFMLNLYNNWHEKLKC